MKNLIITLLIALSSVFILKAQDKPLVMEVVSASVYAETHWTEFAPVQGLVGAYGDELYIKIPALKLEGYITLQYIGEENGEGYSVKVFKGKEKNVVISLIYDRINNDIYLVMESGPDKLRLLLGRTLLEASAEPVQNFI